MIIARIESAGLTPAEHAELREKCERVAEREHPGADEVSINTHAADGPFVTVFRGGVGRTYRFVGWEI